LLAALLAAGTLISACGGGASSTPTTTVNQTSSSTTPTATASSSSTTAGETTAAGSSASTTSTTSAPPPASPSQNLSALVAVCRREVASAGGLTSAERLLLDNVCAVAATGDRARLRAAEHQVCITVLKDSAPGLSGPAVTAAEQSCSRL
jgi:hypothetical protein